MTTPHINLFAYADGLAVIVTDRTVNTILEQISEWIKLNDLKLAPEKTEAMLLIGRKKLTRPITFTIEEVLIIPKNSIKHLGVTLDRSLSYKEHLENAVAKAKKVVASLIRLMPNKWGATETKRRLLGTAVHSILMYASEIWKNALHRKINRKKLTQLQRTMAIRICRGHKTISIESTLVISGIIPIDLLIEERCEVQGKIIAEKKEARTKTLETWQRKWETCEKGRWTYTLIPNIEKWNKRKLGNVTFHITQCLTGHGWFMDYLNRLGVTEQQDCMYCPNVDTVEDTLFQCGEWREIRLELEERIEIRLSRENILDVMTSNIEQWQQIGNMMNKILGQKERDFRRRNIGAYPNNLL